MPGADRIRPTTEADRDAVLALVQSAFSHGTNDGQEEVDIVAATWALGDSVSPIDLVAVDGDTIVGHVLGARGALGEVSAIGIAPLAVMPGHQQQGVGSDLMRELLRRADEAGWPMAVLLGSPDYYGRFGFEPATPFGIVYGPVGAGSPHFQVRRLTGYDASQRGEFTYCWEQ